MKSLSTRKNPLIILMPMLLLLLFSFSSHSANLWYKSRGGFPYEGYVVYGNVNEYDLFWKSPANFFAPVQVVVHETGYDHYQRKLDSTHGFCSKDRAQAAIFINKIFNDGLIVPFKQQYSTDAPPYTARIYCKVSENPADGGWVIEANRSNPPDSAGCSINLNPLVDFASVIQGSKNIAKKMPVSITCDKDADITLSFENNNTGSIRVNDASVKFAFENSKAQDTVNVKKNMVKNLNVAFTLTDTGTYLGPKSASATLLFDWK